LSAPPLRAQLAWLKGYYREDQGCFRAAQKPSADFWRHIGAVMHEFELRLGPDYWEQVSKTSPPVLRYHLYQLIEDDWLTYYLTRVALRLA